MLKVCKIDKKSWLWYNVGMNIFELLSTVMKYVFITIIYAFIFAVIRLIYKDIAGMVKNENFAKTQSNPVLRVIGYKDKTYSGETNEYVLDKNRIVIGRNSVCDIQVDDILVSNRHLLLWNERDEWYIRDLKSKNGTWLNGEQMQETYILDDGDTIKIGELELEFRA